MLNSAKWWRETYSAVPQEGKQTERQESGTLSKQIKWPLHYWAHSLSSPSKLFVLVKHFGVLKFSKIFFKCFELCINDRILLLLLNVSLLDQILRLRKELQYFLILYPLITEYSQSLLMCRFYYSCDHHHDLHQCFLVKKWSGLLVFGAGNSFRAYIPHH